MNTLAYSPLLTHLLKFTSTTVGRDKVYRTVQYWSRFYAWYLLRKGALPADIAPWSALKSHLALARKLMRVGKNLEHARAAAVLLQSPAKSDPIVKALGVGRQLGYAGYLTYDIANWVCPFQTCTNED
jgi:peroxin-11B